MKRIFENIYPDLVGYTFFSVIVWEGTLNVAEEIRHPGWNVPVRIMEARYVIFGRILHRESKLSVLDYSRNWNDILDDAKNLTAKWSKMFSEYEKSYEEFHKKHPQARNCRWNEITKRIIE